VVNVIRVSRKQRLRCPLEMDRDFRKLVRQSFAGANIERNSRPTPVIYAEFHCDVGFGERLGVHSWFLAIARNFGTINCAGPILSANGALRYFFDG